MKHLKFFYVSLIVIYGCGEKTNEGIEEIDNVMYVKGTDDLFSGVRLEYFKNGLQSCSIQYENGIPDGFWFLWDSTGNVIEEGITSNGKKNGDWSFWNGDTHMYSTKYLNDKEQGKRIEFYNMGDTAAIVEIKQGLFHGLCKRFYPTGIVKDEILFVEDKREGLTKEYFESGELEFEVSFANDLRQGKGNLYNKDGTINTITHFKDDVFNGVTITFHENGIKASELTYDMGLPIGNWRYYSPSGRLVLEETYKDGVLLKSKKF